MIARRVLALRPRARAHGEAHGRGEALDEVMGRSLVKTASLVSWSVVRHRRIVEHVLEWAVAACSLSFT